MQPSPSPYAAAAAQLVSVHGELRRALANVITSSDPAAAPAPGLAEYATLFGRFLLAHHHAEDTHLFPALRRAGRLRSADLDFLAGLGRDHLAVHEHCERLIALAGTRAELHQRALALLPLLLPHLAAEEAGLSAERLPHLVSEADLLAAQREGQRAGAAQRQEVGKLLEHPLHRRSG